MKNKRRTKKAGRGSIWMGVGLLLLFLVAAWSGYNILDARRADRAAQNTVEQLQQEIAQKQNEKEQLEAEEEEEETAEEEAAKTEEEKKSEEATEEK